MVTISFSVFLDKLLSREKTQTIRLPRKRPIEVGDHVDIWWKQRVSKDKKEWLLPYVDLFVGKRPQQGYTVIKVIGDYETNQARKIGAKPADCLYKAEITEVFKISLAYLSDEDQDQKIGCYQLNAPEGESIFEVMNDIAKRDGFENKEELIEWFDKHYDISKPKTFICYRWKEVDD